MIDVEVECNFSCADCDEKFDQDEVMVRCNTCDDDLFKHQLKLAVQETCEKDYLWKDKTSYVGFDSDKELEVYLQGVRKGFFDALFWMCDYFGHMEYCEEMEAIK